MDENRNAVSIRFTADPWGRELLQELFGTLSDDEILRAAEEGFRKLKEQIPELTLTWDQVLRAMAARDKETETIRHTINFVFAGIDEGGWDEAWESHLVSYRSLTNAYVSCLREDITIPEEADTGKVLDEFTFQELRELNSLAEWGEVLEDTFMREKTSFTPDEIESAAIGIISFLKDDAREEAPRLLVEEFNQALRERGYEGKEASYEEVQQCAKGALIACRLHRSVPCALAVLNKHLP